MEPNDLTFEIFLQKSDVRFNYSSCLQKLGLNNVLTRNACINRRFQLYNNS